MGYIRNMYGDQSPNFILGFLAAMDTFAINKDGQRWIGSPESELRSAKIKAIEELGGDPHEYLNMSNEE